MLRQHMETANEPEVCEPLQYWNNLNKEVANTISSGVQKEFYNINKNVSNTYSSGVQKERLKTTLWFCMVSMMMMM
ncbi:uncharacterized protein LOC127012064 isoform X3 [Drosophila biarmipes]|uniref:uncharacterized protein LOC127012064 isoform X3 n=1 Tax=Drosophila biarmipes TaxID=125945 RepID=UPI0021CCC96F|nr:uncharacterized protein LOC127012064 isoform X3 [Drosophila biarmipes]